MERGGGGQELFQISFHLGSQPANPIAPGNKGLHVVAYKRERHNRNFSWGEGLFIFALWIFCHGCHFVEQLCYLLSASSNTFFTILSKHLLL